MTGVGEWRLIDSGAEEAGAGDDAPAASPTARHSTLALAVVAATLVTAAAGLAIWATLPSGGASLADPRAGSLVAASLGVAAAEPSEAATALVVDVEGAVVQPGVHSLPAGSRVSDAIAAAGGYSSAVDIAAAARLLNLAEKVVDGAQIRVPALGEAPPSAVPAGPAAPAGGLVDLNHASADELDTLPGVGPVTAQKIISAREEAPFASLDDFAARGVVGAATLDKIRELVTVSQ